MLRPCDVSKLRLLLIPACCVGAQSGQEETTSEERALPVAQALHHLSPIIFRRFALPHPSCPQQVVDFFVSGRGECGTSNIFELHRATRGFGRTSAFLLRPQLVLQDGSLLLAIPVDPLLLLLPLLRQQQQQYTVHGGSIVCSQSEHKSKDTSAENRGYFWSIIDVASSGCSYEDNVRRNIKALALHPAVLHRLHLLCELRTMDNLRQHVDSSAVDGRASSVDSAADLFQMAVEGKLYVRYDERRSNAFIKRRFVKLGNALQRHGNAFGLKFVESSDTRVSQQQSDKSVEKDAQGFRVVAKSNIHFNCSIARVAFELLRCYLPKPVVDEVGAQLDKDYSLQLLPYTADACAITRIKNDGIEFTEGLEAASEEVNVPQPQKRKRQPPTLSKKPKKTPQP